MCDVHTLKTDALLKNLPRLWGNLLWRVGTTDFSDGLFSHAIGDIVELKKIVQHPLEMR